MYRNGIQILEIFDQLLIFPSCLYYDLIIDMPDRAQISISRCGFIHLDNKIDIKFIRSDLEISISGLVSIVSEEHKSNELLFI